MAAVAERQSLPLNAKFWAKRPFGYGGQSLERGQVGRLTQSPNDRLLHDLGYLALLDDDVKPFPCRECGAEFLDQRLRDAHGKSAHEKNAYSPPPPPVRRDGETDDAFKNRMDEWALQAGRMADMKEEQVQKRIDAEAPIDLTKTTASRKG